MSIYATTTDRPNQSNGAGATDALNITEFTGIVEGTIQRFSVTDPYVNYRPVRGTNSLTNQGIGKATLQKATVGTSPDGTTVDHSKIQVTVDTLILSRTFLPLLETFQTNYDVRSEIGLEQGKEIAKFKDQAMLIQATKASQLTTSPYGSAGHAGGTQITMAAAGDNNDPAKLYSKLAKMFEGMQLKDVDPINDGIGLFLSPVEYYVLTQSEFVVNGEYITAEGNSVKAKMLNTFGVPVICTNNIPRSNITAHLLGSAFNGNFTKLVATAFSMRALLAGSTIELESDIWFDKMSKQHVVDSHLSFSATPNRPEYAASLWLP